MVREVRSVYRWKILRMLCFVHEGLCVCVVPFTPLLHAWRHATDKANDFFVDEVEWLEVGCVGFG